MGDLVYLFGPPPQVTSELYDVALEVINKIDAPVQGHIDKSPPQGLLSISFQTSLKTLDMFFVDEETLAFEGTWEANEDWVFDGVMSIHHSFEFIGSWLKETT